MRRLRRVRNKIYLSIHRKVVFDAMSSRELGRKPKLFVRWYLWFFPTPSNHKKKMKILSRYGSQGSWVETGTCFGDTAEELAKRVSEIHTIEPSEKLFRISQERLAKYSNAYVYNGTSELLLPEIVAKFKKMVNTDSINFWLDGHFSGEGTYQGPHDTPILFELATISKELKGAKNINIFIDDVRCFQPSTAEYAAYPDLEDLLEWGYSNSFELLIKNDILILVRSEKLS